MLFSFGALFKVDFRRINQIRRIFSLLIKRKLLVGLVLILGPPALFLLIMTTAGMTHQKEFVVHIKAIITIDVVDY